MPGSGGFTGERCGALTRRGTACSQPAMRNGRCRMHGGKTPRGVDSPHFRHGRYSASVPDRLVGRYEKALADEQRHDLRDEIALAEAKVADLLAGMEHGESARLWLRLRSLELRARTAPDDRRASILGDMLRLIRRGGDEAMAWKDVQEWIAKKQRAVEADVRVARIKQEMVSAEEVMALVAGILDVIRRNVQDQATRSAMAKEIRALGSRTGEDVPIERARRRRPGEADGEKGEA
jgi:hypothetical protein